MEIICVIGHNHTTYEDGAHNLPTFDIFKLFKQKVKLKCLFFFLKWLRASLKKHSEKNNYFPKKNVSKHSNENLFD